MNLTECKFNLKKPILKNWLFIFVSMKNIYIASAVILNPQNELLLVRKQNSVYFQLAGGKIQNSESELDTVIREVQEEIGLRVTQAAVSYLGTHTTQAVNEENTLVHGTVYLINTEEHFVPLAANEIEEFIWMNTNNYKHYKWARLAEEFVQPWWMKLNA